MKSILEDRKRILHPGRAKRTNRRDPNSPPNPTIYHNPQNLQAFGRQSSPTTPPESSPTLTLDEYRSCRLFERRTRKQLGVTQTALVAYRWMT